MSLDRGWLEDEVLIRLGPDDIYRCKRYDIRMSVFTQPGAFSLVLGEPAIAADIRARYKKGDVFNMRLRRKDGAGNVVLDEPLMTGRIDGIDIPETDQTEVEIRGSDNIRALMKSYFMADKSYTEATFFDLTVDQLKYCGFDNDESEWLLTGASAREKAVTNPKCWMTKSEKAEKVKEDAIEKLYKWTADEMGARLTEGVAAPTEEGPVDAKKIECLVAAGSNPTENLNALRAEVGQNRFEWLREQYRKVGLFLWCIPDGRFALSRPNGKQQPACRLQRLLDPKDSVNNIESSGLRDDGARLFSHTFVYGRIGGGPCTRTEIVGQYINEELVENGNIAYVSFKERNVKTQSAADYMARRKAAEALRTARSITFKIGGHSVDSSVQKGQRWPMWINSVVEIEDERLGLNRNLYLGDINLVCDGQGGTYSRGVLYYPEDLVFAEEAAK